jgi:hypothetical protein
MIGGLLALFAVPASAATINVKNTHNDGKGSLRKALDKADFGDRVQVPAGHYKLTTGELLVDTEVDIVGAGARRTILDGNRDSRVLSISYAVPGTVKISGLTVQDGDTEGVDEGGGIRVTSAMTELVLTRVAFVDNRAISDTSFSDGGGVWAAGTVTIKQSLFEGNHGYNGGAVAADLIKASDSTFFNNFGGNPTYNGDGGAFDDEVELTDSTVVGNQCFNGDGCGGGFYGGSATAKGTIFAGNMAYMPNGMPPGSAGNPGTPDNCGGAAILSLDFNLDDHQDCGLSMPGDISGKSPKLGKLRNNGGQTDTLGLPGNSRAVDAGAQHCTRSDQRGVRRPQGGHCDIGAFELAK